MPSIMASEKSLHKTISKEMHRFELCYQETLGLTGLLPRLIRSGYWLVCINDDYPLPESGWKLHVSATIMNAPDVLVASSECLKRYSCSFKVPSSIQVLDELNAGITSYSQVGKFLTVYPPNITIARKVAKALHCCTKHLEGPCVPFDLRYRSNSLVYYRFGEFKSNQSSPDKGRVGPAVPPGIEDPFSSSSDSKLGVPSTSPLVSDYRVFSAISQRGAGGVYLALDLNGQLCVIKEGRKHGEVTSCGSDAVYRRINEKELLERLSQLGVIAVTPSNSFSVAGNFYIVFPYKGQSLYRHLAESVLTASMRAALVLRFIDIVHSFYRAGFLWGDIKPDNLVIDSAGTMFAIDVETAQLLSTVSPARRRHECVSIARLIAFIWTGIYLGEDLEPEWQGLNWSGHFGHTLKTAIQDSLLARADVCRAISVIRAALEWHDERLMPDDSSP